MNKIFTLIVGLAISTAATSQSLEIRNEAGTLVTGTTVVHSGLATDLEIVAEHYKVVNISSSSVSVKCKRYEIAPFVTGTQNALCWALCSVYYAAGTKAGVVAPGGSVTLAAGDTTTIFVLHYKPNGYAGTSDYLVTFFNASNVNDSTSMTVRFDVATSVNEAAMPEVSASAYPNPATNNVTIDLANITERSTLRITDALGQTVKTVQVNAGETNVRISTADLRSGIYFYSVINNNKAVLTRRLIVNH